MKIGILALQGAFREHEEMLYKINPEIKCIEIRQKNDLEKIDGIILPGGESIACVTSAMLLNSASSSNQA